MSQRKSRVLRFAEVTPDIDRLVARRLKNQSAKDATVPRTSALDVGSNFNLTRQIQRTIARNGNSMAAILTPKLTATV
jgi:hypothetical protein